MKITYGISNNNIDVTMIALDKCVTNNVLFIPRGDHDRARLFSDPLEGVLKSIFVEKDGTKKEYTHTEEIFINVKNINIDSIRQQNSINNLLHSNYENKKIIISGGKKINIFNLDNLLYDNFDINFRINMNINKDLSNKKDLYYINNHLYKLFIKDKKDVDYLKQFYSNTSEENILLFINIIQNNKENIECQYETGNEISNLILNKIKCPFRFSKQPRCGYQCILSLILHNKATVSGFGLSYDEQETFYNNNFSHEAIEICHSIQDEINILKWLHNNNYIDATFCSLTDSKLPTLDCGKLKPTKDSIINILKASGICILVNYFDLDILENITKDFHDIFENHKDKIDILDKEECCNDERIFHAEYYSDIIKEQFANNKLFNDVALHYSSDFGNKKTLINKLTYDNTKPTNSGGGWHRDNHDCQFKTIMYLSDVNEENGNFQFLSNSSKKFIGYPTPRTEDYNTRFHDFVINELISSGKCELFNITGKKGTIILVDTTYIHHGKIIEKDCRYAITQYFF